MIASDIDAAAIDGVAAAVGDAVVADVADLADRAAVEAMVARAVAGEGIDILVANAGIGSLGRATDLDPDEWRKVMAVDLDAAFYAARAALPQLIERRGAIVFTASISGVAADYGFTAYNSAKAGLIGLMRNLALDYAAHGVRVNAVSPGYTLTPLTAPMGEPLGAEFARRVPMRRGAQPAEIAEAILFLASPRASYITGHNLVVDGGITAHSGQPDPSPSTPNFRKGSEHGTAGGHGGGGAGRMRDRRRAERHRDDQAAEGSRASPMTVSRHPTISAATGTTRTRTHVGLLPEPAYRHVEVPFRLRGFSRAGELAGLSPS